MKAGRDMTVGKESTQILFFALPMLAGGVLQQLYTIVDRAIVGKYLGPEAVSAIGSSFPIIFTFISVIIGIAMGATIVIAQFFGAKDYENVKRTITTINIFLFFASIVVSVIGVSTSGYIFELLNQPQESIEMAKSYLNIYLGGMIMFFGYNGVASILRGLGDSRTPLYFMLIATFLNIALDYLFIAVFKTGIDGAAYATIIAQGVAFISAVLWLNRYHKIVKISFRKQVFDWAIFKKSMKIGLPSGLQHFIVSLGMTFMFVIVNKFGSDTNAAYSIAMGVDMLVAQPGMILAGALSTFVGQNLGAGKPQRAINGLKSTLVMSLIVGLFVSAILILFKTQIIGIFTSDQIVINIGENYLEIVSFFYLAFYGMFAFNGFLRGAGDTIIPMFITMFGLWVVRLPISYLLSLHYGVLGIWWGIPAAWFSGLLFSCLYFLTGRWRKMKIMGKDNLKNRVDPEVAL